jgi:hypothetical protein
VVLVAKWEAYETERGHKARLEVHLRPGGGRDSGDHRRAADPSAGPLAAAPHRSLGRLRSRPGVSSPAALGLGFRLRLRGCVASRSVGSRFECRPPPHLGPR